MLQPDPFQDPRRAGLPLALRGDEAMGLETPKGSPVVQFEIGDYRNFIYLLIDWISQEALIVDPQKDLSDPLAYLKTHGLKLVGMLVTHTHHDHIAGVPELWKLDPTLPLGVHPEDSGRLSSLGKPEAPKRLLQNGSVWKLGNSEVEILHTPGHSRGEVCLKFGLYLLTGDTLFIRDCGRTDLDTGSDHEMFESLQIIKALPKNTVILPGHHYRKECASLLEIELQWSGPLQVKTVEELKALP
jgi:glyoxylase-like metal-dependent hydrolase (beta-lactamase superfamily II)